MKKIVCVHIELLTFAFLFSLCGVGGAFTLFARHFMFVSLLRSDSPGDEKQKIVEQNFRGPVPFLRLSKRSS